MPNLLLGENFYSAVCALTPTEQAQVNSFVLEFNRDPSNPGISLERLSRARSANVWSGRISRDLRAILHKDGDTWALLHVDHHDPAYRWAERRSVERHPVTGALQVVESVERIREVERVVAVDVPAEVAGLFTAHGDDYLLSLGVPAEWLPTVRKVSRDDHLLTVCESLPQDVAERLFDLAAGEFVTPPAPVAAGRPATDSPDTLRRFYVVEDEAELLATLQAPMERWLAFLHPSQKALVKGEFRGPVKATGSAGTGKTVVAMHRARHLARQGKRVLLTSYVSTLCENIEHNLGRLCSPEELARITVSTVHSQALNLVKAAEPRAHPARAEVVAKLLSDLAQRLVPAFPAGFVRTEWEAVIQAQGIGSWPEYRSARRVGRGKALAVRDRKTLWGVFGGVQEALKENFAYDWPGLCQRAEELVTGGAVESPYDAVLVDEVQDLKAPEVRFLWSLCRSNPGLFMVVGDAGQRIYPGGFSLSRLGVEVRGRSRILRINYRTTEQIRRVADRMLGNQADDLDGGTEDRKGTRSLLKGPKPVLRRFGTPEAEVNSIVDRVRICLDQGLRPEAIAVFGRTGKAINAVLKALQKSGICCHRLSDKGGAGQPGVHIGTMHRAKGLEFKVVLVAGCSASVLPHPKALAGLEDTQDRENAVDRERRLLYVAMTRARDELCITWSGEPSPFVETALQFAEEIER